MNILDRLTVGGRVVVHDDDGATPATVIEVATHLDPVSRRVDRISVSVVTDGGDEWCGVDVTNIELTQA